MKLRFFSNIKHFLIAGLVAGSFLLHACEDDAILEPQDDNRGNNGSYGSLRIAPPVTQKDDSTGVVRFLDAESPAEAMKTPKRKKNPRIY